MGQAIIATTGLGLLTLAFTYSSASAQTSVPRSASCEQITQTFVRDTGSGHGHKGSWVVRLPRGYELTRHSVSRMSANPRRKTYSIRKISDEAGYPTGIMIDYQVPNIGNKGAAKVFGKGERSWLTVSVTLEGQDCSRSARSNIDLTPPSEMLEHLSRKREQPRRPRNPRTMRDNLGISN